MPKALHDKLAREARKKGLTGKRRDAYVYGTLQKLKHEEMRHRQTTDKHN